MNLKFRAEDSVRSDLKKFIQSGICDHKRASGKILLDSNENPYSPRWGARLNRYPDSLQRELKGKISSVSGVPDEMIFLGNGSDELIDLLIRCFCVPGKDRIVVFPPTYNMYEFSAGVNGAGVIKIPLSHSFQVEPDKIKGLDRSAKIIFLCSPNNPTGNLLIRSEVRRIIKDFSGLVVVDEAYIDFADDPGWINELVIHPNLLVMQTLSKGRGLAGARLGMLFGSVEIIKILNSVRQPYNVSRLTLDVCERELRKSGPFRKRLKKINQEREWLNSELNSVEGVEKVFHSDANFILIKVKSHSELKTELLRGGILVRDRSTLHGCENTIRLTIGKKRENRVLIRVIRKFYRENNNEKSTIS